MFKLFKFRAYSLSILRGIHIAFVLLGFFWVNWLSRSKMTTRLISKKYKREGKVIPVHIRLGMIIEKLGPTFVKFGQILADRPDIVSEKFRIELKKFQTEVEPFDHDTAMEL